MDKLKTFFVHILTGIDNKTFDIARVMLFVGVVIFLGLAIIHVLVNKAAFNGTDFGVGLGGLLAGGGAGVGLKANTEPS